MQGARLIIVTGLPATGKSTLAMQLASRYRIALVAKDLIKEPLFETLGATDGAASGRLSDASFAVLFALARQSLANGLDVLVEGNFRLGEHESPLRAYSARIAQILCTLAEPARIERLQARANDSSRHPGHRDAQLARRGTQAGNAFLDLPGERWHFDGGSDASASARLFERVDPWWRETAPGP